MNDEGLTQEDRASATDPTESFRLIRLSIRTHGIHAAMGMQKVFRMLNWIIGNPPKAIQSRRAAMNLLMNRLPRHTANPWSGIRVLCLLLWIGWSGGGESKLRAEITPHVTKTNETFFITYGTPTHPLTRATAEAPAGVQLRFPESSNAPVQFTALSQQGPLLEFGPTKQGALTLRWTLRQAAPDVVERTLEVTALTSQTFTLSFPIELVETGEFASFTGPVTQRTLFDTVRGAPKIETFPVAMMRGPETVIGLAADSPGLWENRCQVLVDPEMHRLSVLTGDGRAPYPLVIKPPEDARDTYQYQMDGWQRLNAGETRRYVTWVFSSPASTHYDAQVAAHLAVANGKGWNSSLVEAILRNTSLYLLRRNLALDEHSQPRDGRYIFISGPGYGWKQWVSDGFYTALGLDDPEKTIESNRAVFWTRMDYEDNSHYYLIWAVLMKRAGGTVNEALVRKAYEFLRRNETNGLFVPPSLPGAPNAKGWKTYHDVLPYDEDDSPASNQGFHCGALMAAKELGLGAKDDDIANAIRAYQGLFNRDRGFMPTSRKLRDTLGQDTMYGATLTYAVFGRKVLTDEQVLTHIRTSERVKTPYGLRVISQADGALLPGHSGVYCYGGSWFLNDAANYLLGEVHGMPSQEVDALLTERIAREIAHTPAFNESISTVDGHPHGHILYSWNSGYWWLRKELRKRLGRTGPDPVDTAIDQRFGVKRDQNTLRLYPKAGAPGTNPGTGAKPTAATPVLQAPSAPSLRIGYTELRTDLPGGRHANVRTSRARIVQVDGSGSLEVGSVLVDSPDSWTQFAGWSPDVRNLATGEERAITPKKPGYAAMWAHWQPSK